MKLEPTYKQHQTTRGTEPTEYTNQSESIVKKTQDINQLVEMNVIQNQSTKIQKPICINQLFAGRTTL